MIYGFIREHGEHSVAKWAQFFQVSRSGYYTYMKRYEEREEAKLAYQGEIKRIFTESGGTYGPDRICGVLRKKGYRASYRKVSRHMAEMGFESVHNRHRTRSLTNSRRARGEGYPNLVHGQIFTKPYQAVCSDVTYLKSGEGWLYLCMVKDIVTGEILGEATRENLRKELVVSAFLNAQARHRLTAGTIFHSDRGSQYVSKDFVDTLKMFGVKQSFSRIGMPGDNAWAESFFATMKKECIHLLHFPTRAALRQAVFSWIEGFYNSRRVQARLGYSSPREYARLLMTGSGGHAA